MKILTSSKNTLECLGKINIKTSEDILNYLPFRYENNSYTDLSTLEDKMKVSIKGKLVSTPKHFKHGNLDIISFYFVTSDNHFFNIKVFNRFYLMKELALGEVFSITGVYSSKGKEISAQAVFKGEIQDKDKLRPLYHLPLKLTQSIYRKLVRKTYDSNPELIVDDIPSFIKNKYRLLDKKDALKIVHFPKDEKEIAIGLRTLKYEECLKFSLKNHIIREQNKKPTNSRKTLIDTKKINEFILNLPFKPTGDQIIAIREIILDMNNNSLMYRLLQGDVGTGKTLVATIALYGNYLRNKIGAFMVPTDSLARQQFISLKNDLSKYGINVELLIGSLSSKEKNEIKAKLLDGKIDVLVGTHALFLDDVIYPNLGLAIIDEQHRFGVNQRNKLIARDDCDLLLMSATPIPRTLSLTIYGDLDISTLTQYPFSKRTVNTMVLSSKNPLVFQNISEALENKKNVFIVAPKIKGEEDSLESVETLFSLYKTLYKDEVRLIHGGISSSEKNEIIEDFIDKKFLILISTTVIELGINVKDASLIIIYSASNFGLASLHQLRGRVGRDGNEATCILIDEEENNPRLEILKNSDDGFKIAEEDMKLRGPGDPLGLAQSGYPSFNSVNIVSDFKMFECARDDVKYIASHLMDSECKKIYDKINNSLNEESVSLFD